MAQRVGKSRHTRLLLLAAACMALSALAAPATAGARDPAVDQYTANLPTAGGPQSPGGHAPQAEPGSLPPGTSGALKGKEGRLLAQVATSPDLGAPSGKGLHGSNSGSGPAGLAGTGRGVPAVASESAGSGPALALIAALAAIAGLAGFMFLRRRRRASSGRFE